MARPPSRLATLVDQKADHCRAVLGRQRRTGGCEPSEDAIEVRALVRATPIAQRLEPGEIALLDQQDARAATGGGPDNVTVVVADVVEERAVDASRLRAQVAEGFRFLWDRPFLRTCAFVYGLGNGVAVVLNITLVQRGAPDRCGRVIPCPGQGRGGRWRP